MVTMVVVIVEVMHHVSDFFFHRVDDPVEGSQQVVDVAGIAVNVAIVSALGAINEIMQVMRHSVEILKVALDVVKRCVRIVSETLDVIGFVLDAMRVIHQVMVDGRVAVVGAELFAKLGRDAFETVGESFESVVRTGNGFWSGESD